MTDLPSGSSDPVAFIKTVGGVVVSLVGAITAARAWPMFQEFLTGKQKAVDKKRADEALERKEEMQRLDKEREDRIEALEEDLVTAKADVAALRAEATIARAEAYAERRRTRDAEDRCDLQRRSGQRYYEIGTKAYGQLVQARHDWRNGKPAPRNELPAFEDMTGTKPPILIPDNHA